MKGANPAGVDVPVDEAGFLTPTVHPGLQDLRRDGEDIVAAPGQQHRQRLGVEPHVAVQEIHPVMTRLLQAALDRAAEAQRFQAMQELDVGKALLQPRVTLARRAVDDNDHLSRLVDPVERRHQRRQRPGQHLGRVALGNDHRHAGTRRRCVRAPPVRGGAGRRSAASSARYSGAKRKRWRQVVPQRAVNGRSRQRLGNVGDESRRHLVASSAVDQTTRAASPPAGGNVPSAPTKARA